MANPLAKKRKTRKPTRAGHAAKARKSKRPGKLSAAEQRIHAYRTRNNGMRPQNVAAAAWPEFEQLVHAAEADRSLRNKVRRAVLRHIKNLHGSPLKGSEKVCGITTVDERGSSTKVLTLQSAVDKLKHACEFCQDLCNLESSHGIATRLFCNSCRVKFSKTHRCPGLGLTAEGCDAHLWISPLGVPSLLCTNCDGACMTLAGSGCV